MKIVFIRSTTNAVGEYRVKHPMRALEAMGHECSLLTLGTEPERVSAAELLGDVLMLQRQTHPSVMALRDAIPPERRPVTVYEVDDNPWEWHSWDPVHVSLGAEYGRRVREVMGHCDAVTCSTPTLAARIRREFPGKPIWVVPNAIDFDYRDWTMQEDLREHGLMGKIVLGWTGSIHHARDGGALLKALPAVFDAYPETVFLMQCDRSIYQTWTAGLQCWADRLRWVPPMAFSDHPRIYSLFDVNLAPLENTPFNTCKSDLRLIEGGAHGVPYVASAIAPYAEFHRLSGGIGGFLAAAPHEWEDGIETLLDGQREARGQSLARYVRETRALSVVAGQWETALCGALNASAGQSVAARPAPGRNDPCPCESGRKYKRCCVPAYG